MEDRTGALEMVTAAMAIIIQTYDLVLSAEIINDAGEKYGRKFVEDILLELTESAYSVDVKTIAKDVFLKRALLSMIVPLPVTHMSTRN
jgi:hypothetical protein|tara:strand:+ start:309 stop:575 length:267 start_codon:yes stop_codon:yes gene_type:complete